MKRILLLLFSISVLSMSCKSNVLESVDGGRVTFSYSIAEGGYVLIEFENRVNEVFRSFDLGFLPIGHYQQEWDFTDNNGDKVAEGIYFIYVYLDGEPIVNGLSTTVVNL